MIFNYSGKEGVSTILQNNRLNQHVIAALVYPIALKTFQTSFYSIINSDQPSGSVVKSGGWRSTFTGLVSLSKTLYHLLGTSLTKEYPFRHDLGCKESKQAKQYNLENSLPSDMTSVALLK